MQMCGLLCSLGGDALLCAVSMLSAPVLCLPGLRMTAAGGISRMLHCVAAFPVAQPSGGVMDQQQPHGMVRSRFRRTRGESAPPAPARLRREPYIEDVAAQQLSATFRVVWQCEVDFRWQCWADYCEEHACILESAWDFMVPQVELPTSASHGENDLWLVNLASMLQQNLYTGTLRRVRRLLVTHY